MFLKLVDNLKQAMQVRTLRNSCREYLTNHTAHIGIRQQLLWYFQYYRNAKQTEKYRLYLWYDDRGVPIGYGALALDDGKLLITECVATKHRGLGHGGSILDRLVRIALEEKRDMVAEIWAMNVGSVALHEKAGFKLESRRTKGGAEIRRYSLSVEMVTRENGNLDRSRGVA
jgi:RimJ/RimL family protein N-acetyltransferase